MCRRVVGALSDILDDTHRPVAPFPDRPDNIASTNLQGHMCDGVVRPLYDVCDGADVPVAPFLDRLAAFRCGRCAYT